MKIRCNMNIYVSGCSYMKRIEDGSGFKPLNLRRLFLGPLEPHPGKWTYRIDMYLMELRNYYLHE